VDPVRAALEDHPFSELPALLRPGDLLVVNDAATLPASLHARSRLGPVEARLTGGGQEPGEWGAVLFGSGSWRERTEDRPPPPALRQGDVLRFEGGLQAEVTRVSELSPRLVALAFASEGDALWRGLYRAGRPVQYSHLRGPLALGHVQTAYAARPWAAEMPSAGRALTAGLLRELRRRGVGVASVTHAAGLSATGDPALDAALPLPERYEVLRPAVEAVARARAAGGRVLAVGTTVVRALEGCAAANQGRLVPGEGVTDLRLSARSRPSLVDGILTGLHEPGTSHYELLGAFAESSLLDAAHRHADAAGYLAHEFGDSCLVLSQARGCCVAPSIARAGERPAGRRLFRGPSMLPP
jgi:S-adenosylmethionine:tRNA ribosyltransferase-isomerase